jgi:tRNA 2-thiouridine synthesizing protein A
VAAGFVDFEITWQADVFSGAPQSSSAADFGTVGINFRARKATNEEEWVAAMQALNCEMPGKPSLSETKERATMKSESTSTGQHPKLPEPDDILEVYTKDPSSGATCATLTPSIRTKLREMEPGQVLEVRVDDPVAILDVTSWSRLSGNQLLATVEEDPNMIRFYLRKKD